MRQFRSLSKDELSLLLYLEVCLVDFGGLVDTRKMNEDDEFILKDWIIEEFVQCFSIPLENRYLLPREIRHHKTRIIKFSQKAWDYSYRARKMRARRMASEAPYRMLLKENQDSDHSSL